MISCVNKYEGEWKNKKKHGKGSYYYANGVEYVGDWENNMQTGQGVYTWPSSDRYENKYSELLLVI